MIRPQTWLRSSSESSSIEVQHPAPINVCVLSPATPIWTCPPLCLTPIGLDKPMYTLDTEFRNRLGDMIAKSAPLQQEGLGYFALYMRLLRQHHQMNRQMLAQRTGLSRADIAFLEQSLLLPDDDSRQQIEMALGTPFDIFVEYNRDFLEQLRVRILW